MWLCMCVRVYVYVSVCMYVSVYCVRVYMYVRVCTSMHEGVCVCAHFVGMYVCVSV
jgi:hypothetical protein